MAEKILVTGGTGLVGAALIPLLKADGHQVVVLSRRKFESPHFKVFVWDYQSEFMEKGTLDGVTAIIHLAGAGVADKRWSAKRKKEIYESRIKTSLLLHKQLQKGGHKVGTFIAASAIGIYGFDTGNHLIRETAERGSGFLADVTDAWEKATDKMQSMQIRLVRLRIGVVLSHKGGALKALLKPPVAAPLGKSSQYISWIHIEDLCRMFLMALNNKSVKGTYNAVAPNPETNRTLTRAAARIFGKPFVSTPVPSLVIRLMLGQMADMVLGGNRISSQAIEQAGFEFKFPELPTALRQLITK